MKPCRFLWLSWMALLTSSALQAQEVTYEERDGVRYQVTRQVVQQVVPTTVMQDRQQTVYAQQITTNNVEHQQMYQVPLTQYEVRYVLRGRWNPFVTPYWEPVVEPVTTWQTQVAKVQIPMSQVRWVPQTQTVQVPATEYRTAEQEIVTRVAVSSPPASSALAQSTPLPAGGNTSAPATLAARPGNHATTIPGYSGLGGTMLPSDPPRQGTGAWQTPDAGRYR